MRRGSTSNVGPATKKLISTSSIDSVNAIINPDIMLGARVQGLSPFWFAIFSIIFIVVLTTILVVNVVKVKKAKADKKKEVKA